MHYLFIGYYVDEETFGKILDREINNMSVARQKFEYNLIRGLYEQLGEQVDFISYVPTDKSLNIPAQSEVGDAVIKHIAIKKDNLKSLFNAKRQFEVFLSGFGKEKLKGLKVIMYAVNPVFEFVLLKYRKKFDIKIVTICSEVPELRRYGNSMSSRIKKHILTYFNEQFDGYILFSAEMRRIIRCGNKKSIVLEGIAPDIRRKPMAGKKKVIMYAGGLAEDNNIPFLLKCCKEISELDEVWICGAGADELKIAELANTDSRIKYFGRLENEKVLELEEQAKVLINFRSSDAELTKYSFPSKILEYISAGSLVISTRLLGIPEEYFDYIIPISFDDHNSIITILTSCLNLADDEYIAKCERAQAFIKKNKGYRKQSERIIEFLDSMD